MRRNSFLCGFLAGLLGSLMAAVAVELHAREAAKATKGPPGPIVLSAELRDGDVWAWDATSGAWRARHLAEIERPAPAEPGRRMPFHVPDAEGGAH